MVQEDRVKISVIIPSYNRKEDLVICLRSVFKQAFRGFEVIVVDDASTDGTKKMLKEKGYLEKIVYLQNKKRGWVSQTKNKGIKKAKGKYYWFLDSDSEVKGKDALSFLFKTLEKNPAIGSLGGEVIKRGQDFLIREHSFFDNDRTTLFGGEKKVIMKDCDYLATCNLLVRADLVKKIGGFNEHYFYGYEDAELGKRILDLGYKNVIDSRGAVFHRRSLISRTANYSLFFMNRIRFALWNFPLSQIIRLPLIDVMNLINGVKFSQGVATSEIRGQSASSINQLLGKMGMLLEYLFGLLYGYGWNLIFLSKTLFLDRQRDFLKNG